MSTSILSRSSALAAAFGVVMAVSLAVPAQANEPFVLDETHADVGFRVSHFGLSDTLGRFNDVEGVVLIDRDNPAGSSVDVTIAAASLDTNHGKRDEHLRGGDFFNVAEHPTITFKSTSVELTGTDIAKVTGDFTMLGVTKPVVLDVKLNALMPHPLPQMNGREVAGFSATTTIKRSEFGMDTFVPAIGDDVGVTLEVGALKQQ
jgi:polyisoprenoid-binding protein YceI